MGGEIRKLCSKRRRIKGTYVIAPRFHSAIVKVYIVFDNIFICYIGIEILATTDIIIILLLGVVQPSNISNQ